MTARLPAIAVEPSPDMAAILRELVALRRAWQRSNRPGVEAVSIPE